MLPRDSRPLGSVGQIVLTAVGAAAWTRTANHPPEATRSMFACSVDCFVTIERLLGRDSTMNLVGDVG